MVSFFLFFGVEGGVFGVFVLEGKKFVHGGVGTRSGGAAGETLEGFVFGFLGGDCGGEGFGWVGRERGEFALEFELAFLAEFLFEDLDAFDGTEMGVVLEGTVTPGFHGVDEPLVVFGLIEVEVVLRNAIDVLQLLG